MSTVPYVSHQSICTSLNQRVLEMGGTVIEPLSHAPLHPHILLIRKMAP